MDMASYLLALHTWTIASIHILIDSHLTMWRQQKASKVILTNKSHPAISPY
ncbi:unnamed protein product [Strongylus vulgaris]|uniref:Uncharacterized protein n=1 Tax=Strongylus vulgaris TaxID=40348 RepID=A0A3P7M0B9_STRVU|nr:unnamed protein product [Strongylus vulgaris]